MGKGGFGERGGRGGGRGGFRGGNEWWTHTDKKTYFFIGRGGGRGGFGGGAYQGPPAEVVRKLPCENSHEQDTHCMI